MDKRPKGAKTRRLVVPPFFRYSLKVCLSKAILSNGACCQAGEEREDTDRGDSEDEAI